VAHSAVQVLTPPLSHLRRGRGGLVHLSTCRFLPTTEEEQRTCVALSPDALPPLPPRPRSPDAMPAGPRPKIAGDGEPNQGPAHAEGGGTLRQVLPLDAALTATGIRGYFDLQTDMPGQAHWLCARCGMSWRAPQAERTCPDGCAPTAASARRGQRIWLSHRQLLIGIRSQEHHALRKASNREDDLPRVVRGRGGQPSPAYLGLGGGGQSRSPDLLAEACGRLGIYPVRDAL